VELRPELQFDGQPERAPEAASEHARPVWVVLVLLHFEDQFQQPELVDQAFDRPPVFFLHRLNRGDRVTEPAPDDIEICLGDDLVRRLAEGVRDRLPHRRRSHIVQALQSTTQHH
jgi:hypothetical protein